MVTRRTPRKRAATPSVVPMVGRVDLRRMAGHGPARAAGAEVRAMFHATERSLRHFGRAAARFAGDSMIDLREAAHATRAPLRSLARIAARTGRLIAEDARAAYRNLPRPARVATPPLAAKAKRRVAVRPVA